MGSLSLLPDSIQFSTTTTTTRKSSAQIHIKKSETVVKRTDTHRKAGRFFGACAGESIA